MNNKQEIFKCGVCGNMVEVVNYGGGTLTCCGQAMKNLKENTTEAATEKHVPVVEKVSGGVFVKVGSVEHPMTEAHYIMWIEVITESRVYRKHLKPGERPEAYFEVKEEVLAVREYCNLHGLWKA